jgi:PII-like signaling protein
MSFGASSRIHSAKFLELSLDLPIVIECVETEENITAILPELDKMVGGGLITLERVNVIVYRPHETEEERPDDWTLDAAPSRVNQKQ